MSKPRCVIPGQYHHISRRCTQRLFLLRPDPEVINLFVWCFAEGCARYGVELLRLTILSNHYHADVYDKEGRLPDFLKWVHREIARGIQRIRGLPSGSGSIFEKSQQTADQIIASEEAFWKMMAYVHCNPTDAGICKDPEDWPGTLTPAGTRALDAVRPDWMTDASGPKEHTLAIHVARHFVPEGATEDRYHAMLREHDDNALKELHEAMRQEGRFRFEGVKAAMRRSPTSSPDTPPKRGSSAFVAVVRDAIKAMRADLRAFYDAYQHALERFRAGCREVVFPLGTWKMTHTLGCCAVPD